MKISVDNDSPSVDPVDSGVPPYTVQVPTSSWIMTCISTTCLKVWSFWQYYLQMIAYCIDQSAIRKYIIIILQKDLQALKEWAVAWDIRVNTKKCYIVTTTIMACIWGKSSNFYQLGGHMLQEVQDNPYLGVTLYNSMKWATHINKTVEKTNSSLGYKNEI